MIKVGSVVQFSGNHKWRGCIGIVDEVKSNAYLVCVPSPKHGLVYIVVEEKDVEYVGEAVLAKEEFE